MATGKINNAQRESFALRISELCTKTFSFADAAQKYGHGSTLAFFRGDSGNLPNDAPSQEGSWSVLSSGTGQYIFQLAFQTNQTNVYIRTCFVGNWTQWYPLR